MTNSIIHTTEDPGIVCFFCPGCKCGHQVWIQPSNQPELPGPRWTWNKSLDKPTFTPSIHVMQETWVPPVTPENLAEYQRQPWPQTKQKAVCHSVVTDGKINFCADCTHALAGQTVPLEPF